MDDLRFDELSRRLAAATSRRGGLKAALGALLGGAAGAAALDAEAKNRRNRGDDRGNGRDADADRKKKRKKKCKPACADGQRCVKGACVCEDGGTACGAECCALGQRCEGGACVSDPGPSPEQCVAAGEPCKNVGLACCDGRVCSSGQGGAADIACYVPKTGRCERTADCVYGMACRGGRCEPPQPGDLATPCDAAAQQLCTTPGAVCAAYTGAGAPNGAFCTLPLQKACSGNPECTCYKCWYSNAGTTRAARSGRASANTMACCHVPGQTCGSERDCCLGLDCVNGFCSGTMCAPDDADGCDRATPCCNPLATCVNGTCRTCSAATCPTGCCKDGLCQPGTAKGACGTGGAECAACSGSAAVCSSQACVECAANGDCSGSPTRPVCKTATNTCVQCMGNADCAGQATNKACKTSTNTCVQCTGNADCAGQATNKACDTAANACVQCTGNADCSGQATNKTCDTATKTCVQCLANADCSGQATNKTCDTATQTCVQCLSSADCSGQTTNKTCNTTSKTCVQCLSSADCSGQATNKACDTATSTCVQCLSSADCAGQATNKACNTTTKTCVRCTADPDCAGEATNKACKTSTNTCVQCTANANCSGSTPACKTSTNTCVQCAANSDCAGQATNKVCDTAANTCVQCAANSDCATQTTNKVCDTTAKTCVQCLTDANCATQTTNKLCDTTAKTCVQCKQNSDCDSLSAGSCKLYTCGSGTCSENGTKKPNKRCNLSGTGDGYCQAGADAGKCGAAIACNLVYSDYADADAAGAALKDEIEGATTVADPSAIIGIPAGTYNFATAGGISLDPLAGTTRYLTLTACEATSPMLDGGWSGGTATDGVRILAMQGTNSKISNVDFRNGNATNGGFSGQGGAIMNYNSGSNPNAVLSLENVNISNCRATSGGGVSYNFTPCSLTNVKITGCKADIHGGGVFADLQVGTGLTLANVTIGGTNSADWNTTSRSGQSPDIGNGYGLAIRNQKSAGTTLTCSGTNYIGNGLTAGPQSGPTPNVDCSFPSVLTTPVPNDGTNGGWYGCGCVSARCPSTATVKCASPL